VFIFYNLLLHAHLLPISKKTVSAVCTEVLNQTDSCVVYSSCSVNCSVILFCVLFGCVDKDDTTRQRQNYIRSPSVAEFSSSFSMWIYTTRRAVHSLSAVSLDSHRRHSAVQRIYSHTLHFPSSYIRAVVCLYFQRDSHFIVY